MDEILIFQVNNLLNTSIYIYQSHEYFEASLIETYKKCVEWLLKHIKLNKFESEKSGLIVAFILNNSKLKKIEYEIALVPRNDFVSTIYTGNAYNKKNLLAKINKEILSLKSIDYISTVNIKNYYYIQIPNSDFLQIINILIIYCRSFGIELNVKNFNIECSNIDDLDISYSLIDNGKINSKVTYIGAVSSVISLKNIYIKEEQVIESISLINLASLINYYDSTISTIFKCLQKDTYVMVNYQNKVQTFLDNIYIYKETFYLCTK